MNTVLCVDDKLVALQGAARMRTNAAWAGRQHGLTSGYSYTLAGQNRDSGAAYFL
jgi:hypothetical protein